MNSVDIFCLDDCTLPIDEKQLNTQVLKILDSITKLDEIRTQSPVFEYKFLNMNFELSFCNDETIHNINRDYRQKDKPTDVITFALFADDENSMVIDNTVELGEVIVSVDTAKKQAQENGNSISTELFTLIAHGILHLLGFDHLSQKDYDFVVSIQNRVVSNL